MDPKILELTRDDPRYTYEAYEFVCDAVTFTQERLGRSADGEDEPDADHHVSGAELLRGACDLAVREFGLMAPVVFKTWGIRTTGDFGELVFKLIKVDRLSKSDRDEMEDFHEVFDLDKALTEGFEMTLGDTPRRGDR
ncbi:MAG: hypothetical protein JWO38_2870 [Gemmataceae bacterium]|nr:hypothetical protein [Gemmataceae bacterium]